MKFTKETFKRVIRTFFESALAYITVNVALVDFSEEKDVVRTAIICLCVSSLAAGISAVLNLEKRGDAVGE